MGWARKRIHWALNGAAGTGYKRRKDESSRPQCGSKCLVGSQGSEESVPTLLVIGTDESNQRWSFTQCGF